MDDWTVISERMSPSIKYPPYFLIARLFGAAVTEMELYFVVLTYSTTLLLVNLHCSVFSVPLQEHQDLQDRKRPCLWL